MATVKMIRGSRIADIFDSPETIAQAEKDGYTIVTESRVSQDSKVVSADEKSDEKTEKTSKSKRQ